jgi:hypothetical protein
MIIQHSLHPLKHAAQMLRQLAADLHEAHTIDGDWMIFDPSDNRARIDHDEALVLAEYLDGLQSVGPASADLPHADADGGLKPAPQEPPEVRLDPHHTRARSALSHLAGAARGLLHQIHEAGGYQVFDPGRQARVQETMIALEMATLAALEVPGAAQQLEETT